MSLLDDVSIVVTPNGYKAGELYAVIPVPTLGAEDVVDGNFPTPNTAWGEGTGWSVADNKATSAGANVDAYLTQSNMVLGRTYKVTFDVDDYTSGTLSVRVFGQSSTLAVTSTGSYVVYLTPVSTTLLGFRSAGAAGYVGSVSNVSVKEYTSADMDVTRETAATRVDENGLVNYAEVLGGEEAVNGDFATDTDWTNEISGWTISNGNANYSGVNAVASFYQNITLSVGKTYKVTYTISNRQQGDFRILLGNTSGSINNSDGTFTEYITYSSGSIFYLQARNSFIGSIDNVSVKEVTRDNVPRIDYTGGGCPHILAEPMRTNLITYSEDFSNAYWTKSGASVTSGFTSPDGTANAYKLVEDTSTGNHYVKSGGFSATSGLDYTFSAYFKKGENNFIQLIPSGPFGSLYANFDLLNGVVGSLSTGTATIELVGEYYRCSFTVSATSTSSSSVLFIWKIQSATSGRAESYTGDGTSGLYAWGGQIEEGSYATSYIPTSGSTVTRNQDIFTRDGIGSLIGQTEGTFFIELSKPVLNPDSYYLISLNNAAADTNANSVTIGFDSSSADFYIRLESGGSTIYVDNNRASLANTFYKIAVAYKSGQSLIYIDGSPITPNSGSLSGAFSFSETLDNLSFDYDGNNSLPFYGKVKQLQVYDTALTDDTLALLTS